MDFYLTAITSGFCLSLMALGIFVSMKVFRIPDITTDGSYTLGAVITALLLPHDISPLTAIPVVLLCGALAGAITGLIHTALKIDALLAGILTMTALYSVNLFLMGRSNIPLLRGDNIFTLFGNGNSAGNDLMITTGFVLLVAGFVLYLLISDFGIAMRATGNNLVMSSALGVNVNRMKIIGLAISNSLTALSGYLVAQYQHFTDINMGIGIVIVGLGSVLIGDAIITWLSLASLWKQLLLVITGSVIFQLVLAAALSLGIDPNLLKLVTALFVLLVVALPALKPRQS